MFERFTDKARVAVFAARTQAAERGDQLRPVYLLYALTTGDGVAARALADLGVDAARIERELDHAAPLAGPLEARGGEPDSGDAEALAAIGIDLGEIKRRIEESFGPDALERVPPGPRSGNGRPSVTRESKQTLGRALVEAKALHHNYIGTEHLLLGLLSAADRNPRGDFTPATLRDLGIDPVQARQRVLDELRQSLLLFR
jgi:hypothetical protein